MPWTYLYMSFEIVYIPVRVIHFHLDSPPYFSKGKTLCPFNNAVSEFWLFISENWMLRRLGIGVVIVRGRLRLFQSKQCNGSQDMCGRGLRWCPGQFQWTSVCLKQIILGSRSHHIILGSRSLRTVTDFYASFLNGHLALWHCLTWLHTWSKQLEKLSLFCNN